MKKVIRVTADEFELDDGAVFPHVVSLEEVPTPEEFQKVYEYCAQVLDSMGLELGVKSDENS